jgi:hypothetical protein
MNTNLWSCNYGIVCQEWKKKELYCEQCHKFTKHISVTTPELIDLFPYYFSPPEFNISPISKIAGVVYDNSLLASLIAGTPYVCTECRRSFRADGLILRRGTHRY